MAHCAGKAADVDDRSGVLTEMYEGKTCDKDAAEQVDANEIVDLSKRQLIQCFSRGIESDVVDEHIDPAELSGRTRDHRFDLVASADVAIEKTCASWSFVVEIAF